MTDPESYIYKMVGRRLDESEVISGPTLAELVASLSESSYSVPVPVSFSYDDPNGVGGPMNLQVVVTKLASVFSPYTATDSEFPLTCYPHPDWKFSGWILPKVFDRAKGFVRVRGVATADTVDGYIRAYELTFRLK